jgi:hypothetical protein
MSQTKAVPTAASVDAFLASVEPPARQAEARSLDALFREVTGWSPKLWGPSIVGYGSYDYRYESGRTGSSLATGFSPRKAHCVIYILPGYADFSSILDRLGPHRLGKSCLYLPKIAETDPAVLRELIRAGLNDLATRWPVQPT